MLCTSILSEVVLGFMLWSGWLGLMQASDTPQPEHAPAVLQGYAPAMPVGYPAPASYPQVGGCYGATCQPCMPAPLVADGLEVCKIQSLPKHLAACDLVQTSPYGAPTSGTARMPCKKPCSWSFQTGVKERTSDGVIAEVTLHANNDGVKETYTGKKLLRYDTPTDMVLSGDHPEPVCIQVMARAGSAPLAMPMMSLPAFGCPPMTAPPMPPIYPVQSARIPDPIPLVAMPMAQPYPYPQSPWSLPAGGYAPGQILPVGLSIPEPKPTHRASVKLVYESGKARLSVKSAGMTSECLRMKLETGAAGAVRLSAGKNHVHIVGTKWKAEADRVEFGDDGRIVLVGHVKLMSEKLGVCAAVKADRLCVQVMAGKFEKIVDQK